MRKIALSIALFLTFALFSPSKTMAVCSFGVQTPGGGNIVCPTDTVACSFTGPMDFRAQCCTTADECPVGSKPEGVSQVYSICDSVPEGDKRTACRNCMAPASGEVSGTWTAIGCIKTGTDDPGAFLKTMLGLGMGVAGGIAFLLILFGGLQIMTSAGNPEQLNAGRELVSAAITGLILIIFSIFLLGFIGGNIVGIPKFG
jgi:hypothetical protein